MTGCGKKWCNQLPTEVGEGHAAVTGQLDVGEEDAA